MSFLSAEEAQIGAMGCCDKDCKLRMEPAPEPDNEARSLQHAEGREKWSTGE